MRIFEFRQKMLIPQPLEKVFLFFSDAQNLNKLTPPNLKFEITTPLPIEMKVGQLIDYKIRLYGLPMSWRTEITNWQPPYLFEDTQIKGPYQMWVHQHQFKEQGKNTEMQDYVGYAIPVPIFPTVVNKLFIKKEIVKIFEYRKLILNEIFQ